MEVAIEELGGARESLDRVLEYLKPLNTDDIEIPHPPLRVDLSRNRER